MKHTPKLIVEDEANTPRVRLIVRCLSCDVIVTDRVVDVSTLDRSASAVGMELGEQDALEWLLHTS